MQAGLPRYEEIFGGVLGSLYYAVGLLFTQQLSHLRRKCLCLCVARRLMGYSTGGRDYLHAEELLYLIEQGKAVVTSTGSEDSGTKTLVIYKHSLRYSSTVVIPTSESFEYVLSNLMGGLDSYLAYKFLRDSEFVAFRSNRISLSPYSLSELGMYVVRQAVDHNRGSKHLPTCL